MQDVGLMEDSREWWSVAGGNLRMEFEADAEAVPETFAEHTRKLNEKLDLAIATWLEPPSASQRRALMVIALYFESGNLWDPKSDMLLGRLIGTLAFGELRAHSDSVRRYENGAWKRIAVLPADLVTRLEDAMNLCRYLCFQLAQADVDRSWDSVFGFLSENSQWADYRPVEGYDLRARHWAAPLDRGSYREEREEREGERGKGGERWREEIARERGERGERSERRERI